jgi:hypothetical protein
MLMESWKNKRQFQGTNKNYSVSKVLREKKKTTDEFEAILNNLNLEEVISLKLELSAKASGGKMYGIPIYKYLDLIVKDAIIKYALSSCHSKAEAQAFLGLTSRDWMEILKAFNPDPYFDEEKLESS